MWNSFLDHFAFSDRLLGTPMESVVEKMLQGDQDGTLQPEVTEGAGDSRLGEEMPGWDQICCGSTGRAGSSRRGSRGGRLWGAY